MDTRENKNKNKNENDIRKKIGQFTEMVSTIQPDFFKYLFYNFPKIQHTFEDIVKNLVTLQGKYYLHNNQDSGQQLIRAVINDSIQMSTCLEQYLKTLESKFPSRAEWAHMIYKRKCAEYDERVKQSQSTGWYDAVREEPPVQEKLSPGEEEIYNAKKDVFEREEEKRKKYIKEYGEFKEQLDTLKNTLQKEQQQLEKSFIMQLKIITSSTEWEQAGKGFFKTAIIPAGVKKIKAVITSCDLENPASVSNAIHRIKEIVTQRNSKKNNSTQRSKMTTALYTAISHESLKEFSAEYPKVTSSLISEKPRDPGIHRL